MNLRRPYGDMTQKEWEAHNRKINYMNDVSYIINYYIFNYIIYIQRYYYGEIDRKNFLRGMGRAYEDEINRKKEEERRRVK